MVSIVFIIFAQLGQECRDAVEKAFLGDDPTSKLAQEFFDACRDARDDFEASGSPKPQFPDYETISNSPPPPPPPGAKTSAAKRLQIKVGKFYIKRNTCSTNDYLPTRIDTLLSSL